MRLRVAVDIAAPPARVWDEIESIERHVDWMRDARRIAFTGPRTRGVNTEFECLTVVGPFRMRDRMRVTEWEPGRAIGIEHTGVVAGSGRFTLRKTHRGHTRFEWAERLRFPWWMGGPLGARVAKPILQRTWRANLRRLKAACEDA